METKAPHYRIRTVALLLLLALALDGSAVRKAVHLREALLLLLLLLLEVRKARKAAEEQEE